MRRVPFVLALLFLGAAVAGCVKPATPGDDSGRTPVGDTSWANKPMLAGDGHDHRDWSQHTNLSSSNFKKLAYDPLATDYYAGKSAQGYFCGGNATTSDGRKIAAISSYDSNVAFVLIDVTDPAKPEKIGEYVIEGTTHYDIDITEDAKYVVIGSDPDIGGIFGRIPRPGDVTLPALNVEASTFRPIWRDACGNERVAGPESQLPLAPATLLVDISDLSNPTLVDALPAPVLGPHSVSTKTVDGVTYVASSITNAAQPADYFQISRIDELPAGPKLTLLSTIDGSQYGAGGTGGGHVDAEIAVHPVTGKMVVYLSNWDGGMVLMDLSNPALPMLLGAWADTGPDAGAVHSTRSVDGLWGDKHYVIAGQEFVARPENRPSGWIYVLDDTDPTNIVEVARWTLPYDSEANWADNGKSACCIETFSTHYFRLVDRTLFVAMYHAGLWAVDLTDPANPNAVGVFVPDMAPPEARREPVGGYDITPFVLDVFPQPDYTMSVFDGYSGLYSVKFDVAHPMPLPKPWPASGQAHEGG